MEGLSVLKALQVAIQLGIEYCEFHTNSKILVSAVSNPNSPVCVQWQVYYEIMQIWTILSKHIGFICKYVQRESNQEANIIAN